MTNYPKSCSGGKRGWHGSGKPSERWKSEHGSKPRARGRIRRKPADKEGAIQLYRSRVADAEGVGWIPTRLQHADRGRAVFQLIVGQRVTQAATTNNRWCSWWRRSKNSRDRNRKKFWRTTGIARMKICSTWPGKEWKDSWRRESRSTVNGESPASQGRYREKPAGSSAWNESWKPRWGRRSMQHGNGSWSPSSGRSNRHAGSVSFSYVGSKKYEASGL